MAAYTLVNLKQVEDQAPKFGYAPNMEARFARDPLETEQSGLSYQRLAPGFHMPFGHRHGEQEEIYVIVAGSGRAKLDDEVIEVEAWDTLRVPGATMRGFEANDEGLEMLVFGAPHTESIAADVELEPNWWSD